MKINVIHDDRTDADADSRYRQELNQLIADYLSYRVKSKSSIDKITGGKSKRNGNRLRLEALQSAIY